MARAPVRLQPESPAAALPAASDSEGANRRFEMAHRRSESYSYAHERLYAQEQARNGREMTRRCRNPDNLNTAELMPDTILTDNAYAQDAVGT